MSSNENIKKTIQSIIKAGQVDDIKILSGSAVVIYDDEEDERYGTIDFQSMYGDMFLMGVFLSAVEENKKGKILFPSKDSDVTVALLKDGSSYVLNYTHADKIKEIADTLHEVSVIGVDSIDDVTDYDEVEETGKKTSTKHTASNIISDVSDQSGENDKNNTVTRTANETVGTIEDKSSSESTTVTQSSTEIELGAKNASVSVSEDNVHITSPKISLDNGGATENAVLGNSLITALNSVVDEIAKITTTTAIGPQPILNIAQVQLLKTKFNSILSNINKLE